MVKVFPHQPAELGDLVFRHKLSAEVAREIQFLVDQAYKRGHNNGIAVEQINRREY